MNRLLYVVAFAQPFDRMKAFYRDALGLPVRHEEDGWIEFASAGARLGLHAMDDEDRQGLALRFEAPDLDAEVAELSARGVRPLEPPQDFAWGRFVELTDPDGNRLSLLQPPRGGDDGDESPIASVVVNTPNYPGMLRFYRDALGLAPRLESPHWAEFDTGETRLALHARPGDARHPLHASQPVAMVLHADDLDAWVDELDARGVGLETPPTDEGFGRYAEVRDPAGWLVVLREDRAAETLAERLAAPFEEAEITHPVGMRRPVHKASLQAGLTAMRSATGGASPPMPAKKPLSATTRAVSKERGSGPERTRALPKRTADEKKTRVKPSERRHIKAVIARAEVRRAASAQSSRSKPVKHEAGGTTAKRAAPVIRATTSKVARQAAKASLPPRRVAKRTATRAAAAPARAKRSTTRKAVARPARPAARKGTARPKRAAARSGRRR